MIRIIKIKICLLIVALGGCSQGGESPASGGSSAAVTRTVSGKITTETGETSVYTGWHIFILNVANGMGQLATINQDGGYELTYVDGGGVYTAALLREDYRLGALVSMSLESDDSKVKQYFVINGTTLPTLIHSGNALNFQSSSGITFYDFYANDEDGDGIADGVETFSLLADENDWDVDNDGLANWFDHDDDGNGTLDVFDIDANGNSERDTNESFGNHFFKDPVAFFTAQVFLDSEKTALRYVLKISVQEEPETIEIIGSSTLFDQAETLTINSAGTEEVDDVWDGELLDDGNSYDNSSGDRVYGIKIKLTDGAAISSNQLVFAKVTYENHIYYVPFAYPNLNLSLISFSSASNTITKSGTPFGSDVSDYTWSVDILSETGTLVHTSAALPASNSSYTPESGDLTGSSHTATVKASSLEKVTGYPVYVISSESGAVE